MRIGVRWVDVLSLQMPRFTIDGVIVHAAPSRRIRQALRRLPSEMRHQPSGVQRRWALAKVLAVSVVIGHMVGLGVIASLTPVHDYLNQLPTWLDAPIAFLGGALFAIPMVVILALVMLWAMQRPLRRIIDEVASKMCLGCSYDLRGHRTAGRCPECGWGA